MEEIPELQEKVIDIFEEAGKEENMKKLKNNKKISDSIYVKTCDERYEELLYAFNMSLDCGYKEIIKHLFNIFNYLWENEDNIKFHSFKEEFCNVNYLCGYILNNSTYNHCLDLSFEKETGKKAFKNDEETELIFNSLKLIPSIYSLNLRSISYYS